MRAPFHDYKLFARRQCDEQCAHIERLEEEAVQKVSIHYQDMLSVWREGGTYG